ncbi:MAG: hypothetical protein IJB76_02730 [Clostridia bacterium]|nr:hypothetical protein [Clostridia bacterium]
MKTKIICFVLVLLTVASAFCSCGGESGKIVASISDAESVELDDYDVVLSLAEVTVSEGLYNYAYKYAKNYYMSTYKSMVEYFGYLSETDDIPVEDTKEFWNTVVPEDVHEYVMYFRQSYSYDFEITDDDAGNYTFGDVLIDHVNAEMKAYLVYRAVAAEYDYVLSRDYADYDAGLENAIALQMKDASFIREGETVAGEDGKVFDWAVDRWEVYLAGQGISREEWLSLYFELPLLISDLATELDIPAGDAESLFDAYINGEAEKTVSFNFTVFPFFDEDKFNLYKEQNAEESTEESSDEISEDLGESSDFSEESAEAVLSQEDVSEELSSDESTDESAEENENKTFEIETILDEAETFEEYSERAKAYCDKIYDDLKNGVITFDDAIAVSPDGENIKEQYPYGACVYNENLKELFDRNYEDVVIGSFDYVVDEENQCIWILEYKEFSTENFTDADKEKYGTIYFAEKVFEKVNPLVYLDEDVLAKYDNPWEIK